MLPSQTSRVCRILVGTLATLGVAAALSACAPLLVGSVAGGTALVATDRRTTGTQLEDTNISLKVESQLRKTLGETARIDATAYMGRVLLTGEAPDPTAKARAAQLAAEVENVQEVINQIRIAPLASNNARAGDTWVTSKVRTTLINTRGVPSRTITVTTDDHVVYLMGKVTRIEADMAAIAAAGVGDVKQVVKVFNIMTPAEEAALAGTPGVDVRSAPKPAPISTLPASSGEVKPDVEVIPVE